MNPSLDDELLTTRQTAHLIGVRVDTLAHWRQVGRGPRFVKVTDTPRGLVRYRRGDVRDWIAQNTRQQVG